MAVVGFYIAGCMIFGLFRILRFCQACHFVIFLSGVILDGRIMCVILQLTVVSDTGVGIGNKE